ncbi:hypothetical protein CVT25_008357 [Psilocybe cyanescens]|uniref:Piwi domain-containing protein n=1 Tax=Psilocybe cyanescens TaxID=93625 RepID=A0A409WVA8_PSICY|nr:hypothetical protein CVT25_008357 [Psilocybe cyanescens]
MTDATSITVRTNSFAITKLPPMEYHQYATFIPEVKSPEKRLRLFHRFQTVVVPKLFKHRAVYDGNAIAYCPARLALPDSGSGIYNIDPASSGQMPGRESQQIKFTQTIGETVTPRKDVEDLTKNKHFSEKAIVATNLIQSIVNRECKNARAYFPGQERYPVGSGFLEVWRGIFQSVRPTIDRMILTVDTCVAVVYAGGPLDNLCGRHARVNNIRQLRFEKNDPRYRALDDFLKGVFIKYRTGNNAQSKQKRIYGLEPNAGAFSFTKENGETTTVTEHFRVAHGIQLAHPAIIGVRISHDKAHRSIVIPLEVCTVIPGQFYKRKLADNLMPEMLRIATLKPEDRLRRITDGAKKYKDSEFVVESRMSLNTTPLEARGKLLKTPVVTYAENLQVTPNLGSWNLQVRPDVIEAGQPGAVEKSLGGVMRSAIQASGNSKPPRILIVILPKLAPAIRNAVKHWGDITHGVLTQCICLENFHSATKRNNIQYWSNVALKINARLRGQNSHANDSPIMKELALHRFMIMGADVSHPGPGVQKPSVTSLVYSFDACATQYAALTNLQEPRVEIIQNMQENVKTALQRFKEIHTRFPVRLFFYRDGVSDGELQKVTGLEIKAIKEAIKELGEEYNIKLTFIVVTKRHHAVFFPSSARYSDNKGNCLPGSVVDHDVTHPAMHNFYLQSHAAIQGTSRSSHYIVLLDENINFDMDRLQSLSYALCHVYAKATRAVSIPAPIYYADLVSSRGMIHLDRNANLSLDDGASSYSTDSKGKKPKFDLQPWLEAFKPVNPGMRNNMYFL